MIAPTTTRRLFWLLVSKTQPATMKYVDHLGKPVALGRKIGTGGEATVYDITGVTDFVAKIYHRKVDNDKAAKLAAMPQLATPEILRFAAWPTATLHQSRGGAMLGVILPRIK